MLEAQEAGTIRTVVFPLFFDHTAREAERAASRLERLAAGDATLDHKEVIEFWTAGTSDETEIIGHLLDPREQDLVSAALDSSALFKGFHQGNRERQLRHSEIFLATEDLIDFETMLQDGINAGQIKSILHPALVDHMRRETLKFADELRRAEPRS
jgi:hypothetical protein